MKFLDRKIFDERNLFIPKLFSCPFKPIEKEVNQSKKLQAIEVLKIRFKTASKNERGESNKSE